MASYEGEGPKVVDKFDGGEFPHVEVQIGDGDGREGLVGDC